MSKTLYNSFNIRVKGKVQGVWFRKSTHEKANELNLTGWVRNCSNGDVEILAQGQPERIEQFLQWCRMGPKLAIVLDVAVQEVTVELYQGFTIE